MKILHILMGLPGAGKTTWANEQMKLACEKSKSHRNRKSITSIEFDSFYPQKDMNIRRKEYIDQIKTRYIGYDEVIIDSLAQSAADLHDLLVTLKYNITESIIIHRWHPDIETCLWNDRGRRSKNSEITIKGMKFETDTVDQIKKIMGLRETEVKEEVHITVRKPDWKLFFDVELSSLVSIDDKNRVRSESWCLGGNYETCWGYGGEVNGEAPPSSFKELDNVLDKILPNLSARDYRKICDSIIQDNEYGESDWYGGHCSYMYWYFMPESLYNLLIEMGLYEIKY